MNKVDDFKVESKSLNGRICKHVCFHPEHGNGVITKITKSKIEVYYNECKMTHSVSDIKNGDVKIITPVRDLINGKSNIWDYNGYNISKEDYSLLKEIMPHEKLTQAKPHYCSEYDHYKAVRANQLIGPCAMDIDFTSHNDFVDSLAYLAYPGVAILHADVPVEKLDCFIETYGEDSDYTKVIHNSDIRSTAYTAFIYKREGMPVSLDQSQTPKGAIATDNWRQAETRIQRTMFFCDLVDHRGFVFNKTQDIHAIYEKVPGPYKEAFLDKIQTLDLLYDKDVYNNIIKEEYEME